MNFKFYNTLNVIHDKKAPGPESQKSEIPEFRNPRISDPRILNPGPGPKIDIWVDTRVFQSRVRGVFCAFGTQTGVINYYSKFKKCIDPGCQKTIS